MRRYLTTRFGVVTFCRQKVREATESGDGYFCPPDGALGLQPHKETTSWVKRRACELAARYTYREAAELLSAGDGMR